MSKRVPIVTGASQGIGRSTAITLARDFASVVLVARNRENLAQTADEVKKAGAEPVPIESEADDKVIDLSVCCQVRNGRVQVCLV
ncbi:SDR family NAD(P)-dependent oxidoreductase [Paraburkholderia sediminicola]|uniref:SDR family NAD(P)-dependent oxidoreductase n=1 Tax=Paraburkholderia sediminicola TaxID=458836 RepID=UPI0038B83480